MSRLTSETFGAEVHGFTGPGERGQNVDVIDVLRERFPKNPK